MYEKCPSEDKSLIELTGACHNIVKDKEYSAQIMRETIAF